MPCPITMSLSKSQRVCFPIALLPTVWIFVCLLLLFCSDVFLLLFHCHELFQRRLSKIQCLCPSVTLYGWAVLKVLVALQTLLTIVVVWKCSPALFGTQLTELWDNTGKPFQLVPYGDAKWWLKCLLEFWVCSPWKMGEDTFFFFFASKFDINRN